MKHALTIGAIALALAMPVLAHPSVTGPGPQAGAAVAAFFPPWWSTTRVTLAAGEGGAVAGLGARFVALLPAGDPARLRAAGAWWIVPAALLGGCSPIKQETDGCPETSPGCAASAIPRWQSCCWGMCRCCGGWR